MCVSYEKSIFELEVKGYENPPLSRNSPQMTSQSNKYLVAWSYYTADIILNTHIISHDSLFNKVCSSTKKNSANPIFHK